MPFDLTHNNNNKSIISKATHADVQLSNDNVDYFVPRDLVDTMHSVPYDTLHRPVRSTSILPTSHDDDSDVYLTITGKSFT